MFYIENFGLDFLSNTKDDLMSLCKAVCSMGRAINGYYNLPYLNHEFGWPQFIVRPAPLDEENKLEIRGIDTHLSGVTEWTFGIHSQCRSIPKDDPLSRQVLAYKTSDGSGAVIINLVNADVLPSFLPGDEITAQMAGFPLDIHYYENEDAYADTQEEMPDGKKMLLADGGILPVGLLSKKENKSFEEECLTLIRGTVKSAEMGLVKFGEEKMWPYINVIISTAFGDLEIAHTEEQIEESERQFIKAGSVVNGLFVLSGDVAIGKYQNGYVLDFDHNLALLRYTLQDGEAERLGVALSDNAEYYSEWTNTIYKGKDEIIDRFNYVREKNTHRQFFAHFATITEIVDGDEELSHSVGERCIIIAIETEDKLDSICFMECDEDNKISKIEVTRNSRYRFAIDEKKVYTGPYKDTECVDDETETGEN